jgi:uracil-DNA glycosylase family 4
VDPDKSSARCSGCPLGDQPVVPGEGPADADRWIVGACPGRQEVIEGRPFVGHAGRRLDKALTDAVVARSAIYVTNAVLCHPPAPRTEPLKNELKACHARLVAEIRQKRPRKLLALGAKATFQVTGDGRPISELRRLAWYFEDHTVVRVTWHPSALALNRDPARSREFDEDIAWLGERDLPQEIRASDIKEDRTAFMTNRQVTAWFKEINAGLREPRRAVVPLASVKPNPFAVKMVESALHSYLAEVLDPNTENPTLFVAGLPGGGYVDVDTAYAHEALVRAGVPMVTVAVVGDFIEADCRRIGLRIDEE